MRTNDGTDWIHNDERADFRFPGERIPPLDRQRGIRKPAGLESALSIRTVYRPEGAAPTYQRRCAICSLAHGELLDAAHTVAGREGERGKASVRNGLARAAGH